MLDGQVAIVTGATSGIGAAIAAEFARQGARVVMTGRRVKDGAAVAERIGTNAVFLPADLTDHAAPARLVDTALDRFGRLDCLVNNAGIPGHPVPIAELDLAAFDQAIAVHVRAPLALIQQAARHMVPQRSGTVLNVASVSGLRAGFSGPDYSIAKAAMQHLTRCAAVDLGQSGIRVNTISPGPIATGIQAKAVGADAAAADHAADDGVPVFARFLPQFQPDPRIGRPQDIADVAVFLASDAARHVNGQDLTVDGALTAGRPWSTAAAEHAAIAQAIATVKANSH